MYSIKRNFPWTWVESQTKPNPGQTGLEKGRSLHLSSLCSPEKCSHWPDDTPRHDYEEAAIIIHLCSWFSLQRWWNNKLLICWALPNLRRYFKYEILHKLPCCNPPRQTYLDSRWHCRTFKVRLTRDWMFSATSWGCQCRSHCHRKIPKNCRSWEPERGSVGRICENLEICSATCFLALHATSPSTSQSCVPDAGWNTSSLQEWKTTRL